MVRSSAVEEDAEHGSWFHSEKLMCWAIHLCKSFALLKLTPSGRRALLEMVGGEWQTF